MSKEGKILTGLLVGIVAVMVGLFAIGNNGSDSGTDAKPVDQATLLKPNSHKIGSGAITLVEFGDYQCPACASAHPNVKRLLEEYDGKITFYFRNFPLTNIHNQATIGALAAEAAGDQGKFWEMHDKLYEVQRDWSTQTDPTEKLVSYATELGLDTEKFKKALADKQFQPVITQDTNDANTLNVQGTPSFFFNGVRYMGKSDYNSLRDHVESLLKEQ